MSKPDLNRDPKAVEESLHEPLEPSKSERKRQMHKLQNTAGDLANLRSDILIGLGLPDSLLLSLEQAAKLKSSNARNRQLRHSAKLMEGEEALLKHIDNFFEEQKNQAYKAVQRQKNAEKWRDKLLDLSQNALSDVFDNFPTIERQELTTLVRNARKEKQLEKPPTQQRKLFKYLRDNVV